MAQISQNDVLPPHAGVLTPMLVHPTMSLSSHESFESPDTAKPARLNEMRGWSTRFGRRIRRTATVSRTSRPTILRRFGRSQRGVAMLEFALVAPFLITLMFGAFELSRYITAIRRITNLANTVAEMVAQNTTGSVNSEDLQFYINSMMIDFPEVLGDAKVQGSSWSNIISVTISSVYFTPTVVGCTSSCTYTAYPAFSGGGNQRPCFVKLNPVPDSSPSTPSTLPSDVYGPGSLIVVDVTYNYQPRVATKLFGTLPIRRSFYIQPRYVPLVKYDFSNGQWWAQACV